MSGYHALSYFVAAVVWCLLLGLTCHRTRHSAQLSPSLSVVRWQASHYQGHRHHLQTWRGNTKFIPLWNPLLFQLFWYKVLNWTPTAVGTFLVITAWRMVLITNKRERCYLGYKWSKYENWLTYLLECEVYCPVSVTSTPLDSSGVPGGGFKPPPPRNSEDIGGVLDCMSKKNRRLDFLL